MPTRTKESGIGTFGLWAIISQPYTTQDTVDPEPKNAWSCNGWNLRDFQHHRANFWARCVDDTFVSIERDQMLEFKEHLNGVFLDIQLALLNVLVCRKDGVGLKIKY
ncbi:unnamed protein product [Schistocephalus solidus]|uniref:Reverse transcriptase domain-containing protein n=1 Tax=Schistocephalus solidus TaxID=70667 RepID=A0A183TML5_SCHSO|nr:unnamed protein product [Schistocephalus solidus]